MTRRTNSEENPAGSRALRNEISARNLQRASRHAHDITYGSVPSVLYRPEEGGMHGNFYPASYQAIQRNPAWALRLGKAYTASRRIARGNEHRRGELDCAGSSDALLMNIFCHPSALRSARLRSLLGLDADARVEFGVRTRTPLRTGMEDRTEMDMRLGDLLVEAKLGESNFQTARPALMERYEGFPEAFDGDRLPIVGGMLRGYQLMRGILAARHHGCRYAVISDARRPDLREQFFAVVSAVRTSELRHATMLFTWQELAATLPRPLQAFLAEKYGIAP